MGDLRLRIQGVFAPRERETFDALNAIGANAHEATDRLEELAHFFPDRVDVAASIAEHRREGERLTESLRMTATFVTPIEREDLDRLAAEMATLVLASAQFATLLVTYRITGVRNEARRATQALPGCARELSEAIHLVRTAGDVSRHTDAVRASARAGDEQILAGLAALFAESPSAIELVAWKDLFERLECAFAAARAAAVTLDVISSKR